MKRILRAFCMCLSNFTALPLPYRPWEDDAQELSLLCLPIVGAVLGFLWYLLALLLGRLLPAAQTALIVTLPWLLTGFMHLKGFLDTSDAIMTWRPLEQRMKALKDPRSGACAVAAMAVLALVSWGAAEAMPQWSDLRALVLIPVVSRMERGAGGDPRRARRAADGALVPGRRARLLRLAAGILPGLEGGF